MTRSHWETFKPSPLPCKHADFCVIPDRPAVIRCFCFSAADQLLSCGAGCRCARPSMTLLSIRPVSPEPEIKPYCEQQCGGLGTGFRWVCITAG